MLKNINILFVCIIICSVTTTNCYNILAIFPHKARSHIIFFSSLVQELVKRHHNVTVINDHPMKKSPLLHQVSLQNEEDYSAKDMEAHLGSLSSVDIFKAYENFRWMRYAANNKCKNLIENQEIQNLISLGTHYDLVLVEQFVTDCGLAVAYMLNAPTIGMTAHVLLPWTYSRLGAPENPAFVPNHFFGSGSKPNIYQRVKSAIINLSAKMYYRYVIQKNDQLIINKVYSEVPDLEALGRNMSLMMLNQYFPLTGSRLYGANVIEIGGMHINPDTQIEDKDLLQFLNSANEGAVYISFGTVANNFPCTLINSVIKLIESSKLKFIWKADVPNWVMPKNVYLNKWLPQVAILCHPNLKAFITHSGMLSMSEAMYCGVPIVGVPFFSDQFANVEAAVENGVGVAVDGLALDENVLESALETVLQELYQNKAKQLSQVWQDRPLSPMNTAVYWIEYVARYKGLVNMRPPTVNLPTYQFFMLDIYLVFGSILLIISLILVKVLTLILNIFLRINNLKFKKRKEKYR